MKQIFCFLSVVLVIFTLSAQQTTYESASYLTENVLLSDNCIETCNFSSCGDVGYFETEGAVPFGVILATGSLANALPPNDYPAISGTNGCGPVAGSLDELTNLDVFDASRLSFDFVPTENSISFSFQLCSEEFEEFAGTDFGDVIGAFVTCEDCPENYDLTNFLTTNGAANGTPLQIHNLPSGTPDFASEYDQCSNVVSVTIPVTACDNYSILFTIGDVGNKHFDSALLLTGESFTDGSNSGVSYDGNTGNVAVVEGCGSRTITLLEDSDNPGDDISFFFSGTATNGTDYTTSPDVSSGLVTPGPNGTYSFEIIAIEDNTSETDETVKINLNYINCPFNCGIICPNAIEANTIIIKDAEATNVAIIGEDIVCIGNCITLTASLDVEQSIGVSSINWYDENSVLLQSGPSNTLEVCPSADMTYKVQVLNSCNELSSFAEIDIDAVGTLNAGDDIDVSPVCYLDNGGIIELFVDGTNGFGDWDALDFDQNLLVPTGNTNTNDAIPEALFLAGLLPQVTGDIYTLNFHSGGQGATCTDIATFTINLDGLPDAPVLIHPPAACISDGACAGNVGYVQVPSGSGTHTFLVYAENPEVNPNAEILQTLTSNGGLLPIFPGNFVDYWNATAFPNTFSYVFGDYPGYIQELAGDDCYSQVSIMYWSVTSCPCPDMPYQVDTTFYHCGSGTFDLDPFEEEFDDQIDIYNNLNIPEICGMTFGMSYYISFAEYYPEFFVTTPPLTLQTYNNDGLPGNSCTTITRTILAYLRCTKPAGININSMEYLLIGEFEHVIYPEFEDISVTIGYTDCCPEIVEWECQSINTELVISNSYDNNGLAPQCGEGIGDELTFTISNIVDTNCPPYDITVDLDCDGSGNNALQIELMLEGRIDEITGMMNALPSDLLPLQQPFNAAPYFYFGNESLLAAPSNIVDWVLVELRALADPSIILDKQAGLLGIGGKVFDANGNEGISFTQAIANQQYFITVNQRSHLAVMSAQPLNYPFSQTLDFTANSFSASGNEQLVLVGSEYCLFAGDYDANGVINVVDFNLWQNDNAAVNVYYTWDSDGNGIINVVDFNAWFANRSKVGITEIQL